MLRIILFFIVVISSSIALGQSGKELYMNRCAMCHGVNGHGDGPLANKSNPPASDFTSCQFRKKLTDCPGRIVSSIILQPNGTLIPDTLKRNGINLPKHLWTDIELRSINQYILSIIEKQSKCKSEGK